jgi:hypothetical protein
MTESIKKRKEKKKNQESSKKKRISSDLNQLVEDSKVLLIELIIKNDKNSTYIEESLENETTIKKNKKLNKKIIYNNNNNVDEIEGDSEETIYKLNCKYIQKIEISVRKLKCLCLEEVEYLTNLTLDNCYRLEHIVFDELTERKDLDKNINICFKKCNTVDFRYDANLNDKNIKSRKKRNSDNRKYTFDIPKKITPCIEYEFLMSLLKKLDLSPFPFRNNDYFYINQTTNPISDNLQFLEKEKILPSVKNSIIKQSSTTVIGTKSNRKTNNFISNLIFIDCSIRSTNLYDIFFLHGNLMSFTFEECHIYGDLLIVHPLIKSFFVWNSKFFKSKENINDRKENNQYAQIYCPATLSDQYQEIYKLSVFPSNSIDIIPYKKID